MLRITIITLLFSSVIIAKSLKFVSVNYCPFVCNSEIEDGREGFMTDIVRAVFEPKGYTIEIQKVPYMRAISKVECGEADGIMIAIKEFSPSLVFPKTSTGVNPGGFYVKHGNPWRYEGLVSLKDLRVAAVKDYMYSDSIVDSYIKDSSNVDLIDFISTGQNPTKRNFQKLIADRVDTYVEGTVVARYTLFKNGFTQKVKFAGFVNGVMKNYTAFTPTNSFSKVYARILDEGIVELKQNGTLALIMKNYGLDISGVE